MKLCDCLGGGRDSDSLRCTHTRDAVLPLTPGMVEGMWVCAEAASGALYPQCVWVAPGPQVSFLGASVSLASSGLSDARGGITQAPETVSGHFLDTA